MPAPDDEVVESLTPPLALASDVALALLRKGEITIEGRITSASNATLYCRVSLPDGLAAACVYKPIAGERPLWDYPDGTLAEREVAAFVVSEAAGWGIVPPTVLRDGPLGEGMVQLWVADDQGIDVIDDINSGSSDALAQVALFDAVINNGDRKVSHLLAQTSGAYLGVDHGVSFGLEHKLRTVLWQWAGDSLPDSGLAALTTLTESLASGGDLRGALEELLTGREVKATARRVSKLLSSGRYPLPPKDWPAVPYPPY